MNSFWRLATADPAPKRHAPTAPFFERRPAEQRHPLDERRRSLFFGGWPTSERHPGHNCQPPPFLSAGQCLPVTQGMAAGAPFFNQLEKDIWTPPITTRQQPSLERHPTSVRRCRTLQ